LYEAASDEEDCRVMLLNLDMSVLLMIFPRFEEGGAAPNPLFLNACGEIAS